MGDFTDERLAEVEGLAKEATQGRRTIEPHGSGDAIYCGRGPNAHGLNIANVDEWGWNADANKAFIAATDPDTVLSMCQRIREQAEEIGRLTLENAHLAHISGRG